jgi:hypothetical protein
VHAVSATGQAYDAVPIPIAVPEETEHARRMLAAGWIMAESVRTSSLLFDRSDGTWAPPNRELAIGHALEAVQRAGLCCTQPSAQRIPGQRAQGTMWVHRWAVLAALVLEQHGRSVAQCAARLRDLHVKSAGGAWTAVLGAMPADTLLRQLPVVRELYAGWCEARGWRP